MTSYRFIDNRPLLLCEGVRLQARSAVCVPIFSLRPATGSAVNQTGTTGTDSCLLDGRGLGRSYKREQGEGLFLR